MQKRHKDRKTYFNELAVTVEQHILPFIQEVKTIDKHTSILEIGCGEGGNLLPFLEMGCERIVGIDMSENKIKNANKFFGETANSKNIKFIVDDIYNLKPEDIGQFDLVITKDVLEHIHGQEKFMAFVRKFMKPDAKFFLGFPPWHNPSGGHQQMCKSKVLSKMPYIHILPRFMYRSILKAFGETENTIANLIEIKDTGITIERFERILKKENYHIDKRVFYFVNPHYEVKFGLKPRKLWKPIGAIPFFRGFIITTNYYLISKKKRSIKS